MSADKICCVPGCTKSREDDFVLHKFPNPTKDQTRFCTWVQAVGGNLLCLDDMYVFKYRRICHTHFEFKYWTRSKMLSNIAIPTLHMKGSQCSEKLKNLRSVLVQHVKSHASESSAKTRKPFYLADTMQFAIPNIKASKTFPGKSPNKKRDLTADKDNEEDEDGVKSVPSFSHMPYSVLSVSSLHSPSSPMSSPPSTPPPRSGHPDVKKLKRRINIEVNNEDYLNTRKAKIEKTANDSMEDPKRMFLLSLLPDVNAMSDNQMRMFKRRVISLVEEILEEKSHSPT